MEDVKNETEKEENVHNYDEELAEFHFTIKDGKGVKNAYVLREMEGPGLTRWMEITSSRTKRNRQGLPVGKINFDKFQAQLLALCVFDKKTGQLVSADTINGWKASIQNDLFLRARKMNGLDEESAEEAKND